MDAERNFLYLKEVQRYFGIQKADGSKTMATERAIRRMFDEGLKHTKIGCRTVVFKADLEEYLESKRNQSQ